MTLFRWAGHALLPLHAALTLEERRKVRAIPGAQVDEQTGETFGSDHVLATVAAVFGAKGNPPNREEGKVRKYPALSRYQNFGVSWLNRSKAAGALCHDDVGVGKTPQAIAALAGLPIVKLVLCPGFLRSQWRSEIKRWTKIFRGVEEYVHIVKPPSAILKRDEPLLPAAGSWVVAFYRDAQRAVDAINEHHAQGYALVVDEVHNLRTLTAQQTSEVRDCAIWASARIGLTGDALVNDIPRLYSVLDIIQPGAFGSYRDFIKRYAAAVPDDFAGWKPNGESNMDELRDRLRYFSYRRTWDDIPASERPFDTMMQTVWIKVKPQYQRALRSLLAYGIQSMAYAKDLAEAKMEVLSDSLLNDSRANIPTLTFTHTKAQAKQLAAVVKGLAVTSHVPQAKRLTVIEDFVKECQLRKKVPHVCATWGSLGEGANLQWAKVVNFGAIPFGSDVIRQAFARAARRGNEGTITARFFVARGTSDEHMIQLVQRKARLQMTVAGKQESAKLDLVKALEFSQAEIDDVLKRMKERALEEEVVNG